AAQDLAGWVLRKRAWILGSGYRPALFSSKARRMIATCVGVKLASLCLPLVFLCSACGPRQSNPEPPPLDRPSGPLSQEQAERYVVQLVNRHRAAHDLKPVERDDVAAKAAQRHAADMTRVGFTAHWGSDGSVPEQRYSEAGGRHL